MNPSPSVTVLPFRRLPRQPRAFLEYIDLSPQVLAFYQRQPSVAALSETAAEIRQLSFPRREMAEILRKQNEAFGCSARVLQAIDDLAKPDSVAILTGQQIGLFTGPVLTIYKALTALRLSEELHRSGFNAAPIFWMASDDHDLAEIARISIPGLDAKVHDFDARAELFGSKELPPYPVGDITIPEAITGVASRYLSSLSGNWSAEIQSQIASAYQPGISFASAFGRLMARLFGNRGLILFDPRARGAKQLSSTTIGKALDDARILRAQLGERSRLLKTAGLDPQVSLSPRSTLVFLEEDGKRRLLVMGEDDFILKDAGRHYTASDLSYLMKATPELFSPNVLLRPVVQDHLFPTVAYVGGPAEISYFAQVEPLYRHFGRPMPVIWPRHSITVLEPDIHATMKRRGLRLEDCFQGKSHLIRQILQARPGRPEVLLADLGRNLDREIEALKATMLTVDASLGPAADTVRRKLLHRVRSLETKFMNFEMRRNRGLNDAVSRVMNSCCPNGNLQEREIGVHYLLARLGPSLMDVLYETVDIRTFAHRILHFHPGSSVDE